MHVTVTERSDEVVAARIADVLARAVACRNRAVLIGSAGRTPTATYRRLVSAHRESLDWSRVSVVQMDDYVDVAPHDPTSLAHYLVNELVEPLGIRTFWTWNDPRGRIARPLQQHAELARGADMVLHGIGRNGHVGFNEPPSPSDAPTRIVNLSDTTLRDNGFTPAERRGITLGLDVLLTARSTILLALGHAKAEAVRRATTAPVDQGCPAAWLRSRENYDVVVDSQAAALL